MNSETCYSEKMKSFLSESQTETTNAFNFVRLTVHSMEDSLHSASSQNSSFDRAPALKINEETQSYGSETSENHSLSTSFGMILHMFLFSNMAKIQVRTQIGKQIHLKQPSSKLIRAVRLKILG